MTLPIVDNMNLLSWVLIGLAAGILAHMADPADIKGGIFNTLIAGMLGALIGGLLAPLILGVSITGFNISSILIAFVGALLLALLGRLVFRNPGHIKTTTKKLI